jgi:hypothetical protein
LQSTKTTIDLATVTDVGVHVESGSGWELGEF